MESSMGSMHTDVRVGGVKVIGSEIRRNNTRLFLQIMSYDANMSSLLELTSLLLAFIVNGICWTCIAGYPFKHLFEFVFF